jgi:hypothetical protein
MIKSGGDFAKLESWEKALGAVDQVLEVMSKDMAEELVGLVKEGWRTQADPYGQPWKAKKRPDRRQILVGKTARLKGGWHVRQAGRKGFTIAPSVDYGGFHQQGTKFIPPRRMVPTQERGLPREWARNLAEIAQDHLAAHLGSRKAALVLRRAGGMGFVKGRLTGLKRRFNLRALIRKAMRAVTGE